jgi:hypothetical protein
MIGRDSAQLLRAFHARASGFYMLASRGPQIELENTKHSRVAEEAAARHGFSRGDRCAYRILVCEIVAVAIIGPSGARVAAAPGSDDGSAVAESRRVRCHKRSRPRRVRKCGVRKCGVGMCAVRMRPCTQVDRCLRIFENGHKRPLLGRSGRT